MKIRVIISLLLSLCSVALAQPDSSPAENTPTLQCSVSSNAAGEKSSHLNEKELEDGRIVEFKDNSIYIGLSKKDGGYYKGLIQINSKVAGRPVTTNYLEVVKSIDYSANTPGGSFISVTCLVR